MVGGPGRVTGGGSGDGERSDRLGRSRRTTALHVIM